MQDIILKAIEGGWEPREFVKNYVINIGNKCIILDSPFEDSLFWRALGKSCGWKKGRCSMCERLEAHAGNCVFPGQDWMNHALCFHEINLTEGFDKAVEYLQGLIKK